MPRAARASAGKGGTSNGRFSANPPSGHLTASDGMPSSGGCSAAVASTLPSLDDSAARITLPADLTASTSASSDSAPLHSVPFTSCLAWSASENSTS